MVYMQLGCCCPALVAFSLKGLGEELAGIEAIGQAGGNQGSAFRAGLQTDLVTLAVPCVWI